MDIYFTDTGDGGELELAGGDLKGDKTLYTAVYLSLFGGDTPFNVFEEYTQDGSFETALNQPITAQNLKAVENAAKKCLKWMQSENVAETVEVSAYGDTSEKINVDITITQPSGDTAYSIVWENQKAVLRTN